VAKGKQKCWFKRRIRRGNLENKQQEQNKGDIRIKTERIRNMKKKKRRK
jgi:hypothetical protein